LLLCWNLNSGPTPWASPPTHFFVTGFFNTGSWTICSGWLPPDLCLLSS
jgi:hypothetical protein